MSSHGHLWGLVQAYIDRQPYPPSVRQIAGKIEVAPTTLTNWGSSLTDLPKRRTLVAFADLAGLPYQTVLDAVLHDIGYLPEAVARAGAEEESVTALQRRAARRGRPDLQRQDSDDEEPQ